MALRSIKHLSVFLCPISNFFPGQVNLSLEDHDGLREKKEGVSKIYPSPISGSAIAVTKELFYHHQVSTA